jgi:hypothetical protein
MGISSSGPRGVQLAPDSPPPPVALRPLAVLKNGSCPTHEEPHAPDRLLRGEVPLVQAAHPD